MVVEPKNIARERAQVVIGKIRISFRINSKVLGLNGLISKKVNATLLFAYSGSAGRRI